MVFSNPTNRDIKLIIRIPAFENLHIQLFDMNGTPLQDKKIESEETEIPMDNLIPSVYFLKVLSGRTELKTFKIIKN